MLETNLYFDLVKQKQFFESNVVDLGTHAIGLSQYMLAIESETWHSLSQWFHIAKSIKNLSYDGIRYDSGYFMCRPAYEYEQENQKLYERLIKEITVFSYMYSGLEALVSSMKLPSCPKQTGKINSAAFFLKSGFQEWFLPIRHYNTAVRLCEQMYQLTFDKTYKIASELSNCISIHGLGIKLLYKLRNKIMHGDFFFPEPLSYSSRLPFQPEIINLCSRLVLMSVQMLLLVHRKKSYITDLIIYESSILEDWDSDFGINEKDYLTAMHLIQPGYSFEQLKFDFI